MVLMALDHVREYFHNNTASPDPLNLNTTTPALFLTRWVTHLCAPVFVFLAGTSAYLSLKRSGNINEARRYLIFRGLFLIILDLTLINFILWFDIRFGLTIFEVVAAIGAGFIILSFFISFPWYIAGIAGIIIIFLHNLLPQEIAGSQTLRFFYAVLFRPALIQPSVHHVFYAAYPVVPWAGVMLAGFACGKFFEEPEDKRTRIFLVSGILLIVLFIFIRTENGYGDPSQWLAQTKSFYTFLSYLNLTKYPPSLLFILLFTGIMFIILAIAGRIRKSAGDFLAVYGRVPLFYFVIHLLIIHTLMIAMVLIQGFSFSQMRFGPMLTGRPRVGSGVSLAVVWVIWIVIVLGLYPVCRWYGKLKEDNPGKEIFRYL